MLTLTPPILLLLHSRASTSPSAYLLLFSLFSTARSSLAFTLCVHCVPVMVPHTHYAFDPITLRTQPGNLFLAQAYRLPNTAK